MEELPAEVMTYLSKFLSVKDTKSFSRTCRWCYSNTIERVWRYPKLRFISLNNLTTLTHLPIRHIRSEDIGDFTENYGNSITILTQLPQLRVLELNHYGIMNIESLRLFTNTNFWVIFCSSLMNFNEQTGFMDYVRVLQIGSMRLVINHVFHRRWDIGYLRKLLEIPIHYIDMERICLLEFNGNPSDTRKLIHANHTRKSVKNVVTLLQKLNPGELNFDDLSCCEFYFLREDFNELKFLKISTMSTAYLEVSDKITLQPVLEFKKIDSLQRICIEAGAYISVKLLLKFPVKYVVIDDVDGDIGKVTELHGTLRNIVRYLIKEQVILRVDVSLDEFVEEGMNISHGEEDIFRVWKLIAIYIKDRRRPPYKQINTDFI